MDAAGSAKPAPDEVAATPSLLPRSDAIESPALEMD